MLDRPGKWRAAGRECGDPVALSWRPRRQLQLRGIAAEWDIPIDRESSLLPSVAGLAPEGTAVVCGIGPSAVNPFTAQEAVQRMSLVQRTLLLAAYLERVADQSS